MQISFKKFFISLRGHGDRADYSTNVNADVSKYHVNCSPYRSQLEDI